MGSSHSVPWKIDTTVLASAVRLTIGPQVAQIWGEPPEPIWVEKVLSAFPHDSCAVQRSACDDLVALLVKPAKLLGLVKRQRTHHHERRDREAVIGGAVTCGRWSRLPPSCRP